MKKLFSNASTLELKPYSKEFDKESLQLCIKRLNIINVMMLFLCVYLFYNDYFVLKSINNISFRQNLFILHIVFFATAITYLIAINILKRIQHKNIDFILWALMHLYIAIGILLGMAVSYNNAKVELNIYTYITIIMFLSIFMPTKKLPTFIIIVCLHLIFFTSLSWLQLDPVTISMNRINSTVSVITSLVLYLTFTNYRVKGFIDDKKLIEQQNNLNTLFEINPLALILISITKGNIILINNNAMKHFVENDTRVNFGGEINTYILSEEDKQKIIEKALKLKESESQILEISNYGKKTWVVANFETVNYNSENCILVALTDITDIKIMENELVKKASIDSLTGILNRAKGMEMLQILIHAKKRRLFSIVFCDIDELKTVNDKYGHSEGDHLIYFVSQAISNQLDADDFVFRYGGDEFIVVLLDKGEQECKDKIESMKRCLSQYGVLHDKPYHPSFSYGIKVIDESSIILLDDIIGMADKKMYMDKMKKKR